MTELQTLSGQLPAAEGVNLMLASRFKYAVPGATPAANVAPVFSRAARVSGKAKFKAMLLRKPAYNARPVKGACDQSQFGKGNPVDNFGTEFDAKYYDQSGELCISDFVELCNNWQGSEWQRAINPAAEWSRNTLLQAAIMLLMETMQDDLARIAWFSKSGFAVNTANNAAPFYVAALPAGAADTMGEQDCFWAKAVANAVATTSPYVNSNDGTNDGALNPTAVQAFLRNMIMSASPELRGLDRNSANAPFFLVDAGIFEAYRKSLQTVYNANGWTFGQEYQDTLTIDGYKIYRDDDADKFDREMGAMVSSTINGEIVTHSRNLRACFIAPKTAYLGVDAESPAGDGIGMVVATGNNIVKDAGKLYYKMMLSVGVGILDPNMMVVAYPSNNATFN